MDLPLTRPPQRSNGETHGIGWQRLSYPACGESGPAAPSATTAELRQSRQNSLPSVSVITMKPAL
ncbi:MAG TPA: hypothetical protein VGD71_13510, partial [Kribbella sp.]